MTTQAKPMYRQTRQSYTFRVTAGYYADKTFTVEVVTEHKQSHGDEYRLRSVRDESRVAGRASLGCSRDYSEFVAEDDMKAVECFFAEHGIRQYVRA